MRPHQQIYLADLLHEHEVQLEATLLGLTKRTEPLSELEARQLVAETKPKLRFIDESLRFHHSGNRRHRIALRRLRAWTKPRLGILQQYAPRPLRVPASYLETAPPAQAPTVSIVTPSFQQAEYLERTLHSVIVQGYPALEYIVQDGGSQDGTVDVLERYEPLLAGCIVEPDLGQADAINRGFARTSGEIMAWLNSDDLLLPGALAYVTAYFAAHPEVDVVYGHRLMIDSDDGQIGAWVMPAHDDRALTYADYVPQETLFWRRRIWEASGGHVDTSFSYALDWDLLLRFRDAGARMKRLPRFLGAFRIHDAQKTSAAHAVGLEEMRRLRVRVHGRNITQAEILASLRPFFARHIAAHTRQRLADRLLPQRAHYVRTLPPPPAAPMAPRAVGALLPLGARTTSTPPAALIS